MKINTSEQFAFNLFISTDTAKLKYIKRVLHLSVISMLVLFRFQPVQACIYLCEPVTPSCCPCHWLQHGCQLLCHTTFCTKLPCGCSLNCRKPYDLLTDIWRMSLFLEGVEISLYLKFNMIIVQFLLVYGVYMGWCAKYLLSGDRLKHSAINWLCLE